MVVLAAEKDLAAVTAAAEFDVNQAGALPSRRDLYVTLR